MLLLDICNQWRWLSFFICWAMLCGRSLLTLQKIFLPHHQGGKLLPVCMAQQPIRHLHTWFHKNLISHFSVSVFLSCVIIYMIIFFSCTNLTNIKNITKSGSIFVDTLTAIWIITQDKRKACLYLLYVYVLYLHTVLNFSGASIHYCIQSSECTGINHPFSEFGLVFNLLWGNIVGSVILEHSEYEYDNSLCDWYIFFDNILACYPGIWFFIHLWKMAVAPTVIIFILKKNFFWQVLTMGIFFMSGISMHLTYCK